MDEMNKLSFELRNILNRANIHTKDFLIECLEDKAGAGVGWGVGAKRLKELEDFVGFKIKKEKKTIKVREGYRNIRYRDINVLRRDDSK